MGLHGCAAMIPLVTILNEIKIISSIHTVKRWQPVLFGNITGADKWEKEASSGNRNWVFYFLFQTEYKEILVMPSATGKLRRGELGRGRNRAPVYKVTRENQSPLEWSWHWRHRNQQTVDQWAPLGGGSRRGPGQDIAPRKVCHALSKPPPQSCRRSCYLFRCLSLNVVPPVSAECPCHAHRTELRSRWCELTSHNGECFTDTHRKTLSSPIPTPDSSKILFPAYENIFGDFFPLSRGYLLTF